MNVFSTRLYFDLNPEDELPAYGKAAATALLFLAAAIVLLLVYKNHLIRRAERFVTVTGKGYRPSRYASAAGARRPCCSSASTCWPPRSCRRVVLVWTSFSGGGNDLTLDAYRTLLSDTVSRRRCATPSSWRAWRRPDHPDRRAARLADPAAPLPAAPCSTSVSSCRSASRASSPASP